MSAACGAVRTGVVRRSLRRRFQYFSIFAICFLLTGEAVLMVWPNSLTRWADGKSDGVAGSGIMLATTPTTVDPLVRSVAPPHISGIGPLDRIRNVPENAISMPWKYLDMNSAKTVVQVLFAAGDGYCVRPLGVALLTRAQGVTLIILSTRAPAYACPASLRAEYGTVRLDRPLGSQALLHAPVDPAWPGAILDTL
jgi:hypothetical protein